MDRKEKLPPLTRQIRQWLDNLMPGEAVERRFEGPGVLLKVRFRDEKVILCDHYVFDALTSAEINDDLQWGPFYGYTGSFIRPPRCTEKLKGKVGCDEEITRG